MPRGVPKAKAAANETEMKAAEERRLSEKYRRELAAQPDRDVAVKELSELLEDERRITDSERINIVVEYACLGQDPKPEKYVGRPRYIKGTRHGRTRLAKRSARRDDVPPPEEKMFIYDDEVARVLHVAMYASLRQPGTEMEPRVSKDETMEDDEHAKEHSRDSGCPVSPAGKEDKKEGSSRGSVEKESRKRRSPDLLADEGANSSSGTSHFIVKGNTPLTVIHKLLERKRQIHQDLRLELIDASGKEILSDEDMNRTVAYLANERKWTRNRPLRILYTITRFTENEDIPVLDVQEKCDMEEEEKPVIAKDPSTPVSNAPSPQQLQQLQQMQMHQMQHMQHMQQLQHQRMQHQGPMMVMFGEDGSQHFVPVNPAMMMHQQEQEGLLKLSAPPGSQAPPPAHHHFMGNGAMGGVMTPPPGQQQQQQSMTSSSIFPSGHVIVENGHGSHLVPANMSVESVISSRPSTKKRQRMAPQRARDVDALMRKHGIAKGRTIEGNKPGKSGGSPQACIVPGIVSIRMPNGCTPNELNEKPDLPIEAITVDGRIIPTTYKELPTLSKTLMSMQAAASAAAAAAHSAPPPSMLTPEERIQETISTVRSKAAVDYEKIQAERRASNASSGSAAAAAVEDAAPVLQLQPTAEEEERSMTPPPLLDAPDTPDSAPSLEIDEMMEDSPAPPPPAPQSMQGIPA